jgi:ubiquinone/menaquinone biosynthesis C-methylase UbiE
MKNHFNDLARDWDKNLITKIRTDAIAEELRKIIPLKKEQTAMEFGAGTGLLSIGLKDLFSEIVLMDSSSEMIKVTAEKLAKINLHHLSLVLFDLEKEDYTVRTFDYIFSQMSLHHVLDIEKIITKFYKLLNPGGTLAIVDLYKEDGTFHEQDFNGHLGFDPEKLVLIYKKAGFVEISYKPCFEITKSEGPNAGKTYPLFLLVGKKCLTLI